LFFCRQKCTKNGYLTIVHHIKYFVQQHPVAVVAMVPELSITLITKGQIRNDVFGSPDKLRDVVLKFNEQNALDEMILAPATYKNTLTLQDHATVITDTYHRI